ncbi:MAG TPA: cytochrome c peroxidase [Bryobacteraceae bacterium]|nr:cytochrome c peroxidase [Bryobacteraceae bacterium]
MRACVLFVAALSVAAEQPPLGLDAYVPAPGDNPSTPEKIALGRQLFHDKRLSRDNSFSCATCHNPERAFTDDKPLAIGVAQRKGTRRSPAIINRGYGRSFFWDGRTSVLEEQVLLPIVNPVEMDLSLDEIPGRTGLDAKTVASALATYVRSILAGDSPFDRYIAGDRSALSDSARRGLALFRGKGNCATCHVGPNLTDEKFHNTGVGWNGASFSDRGRAGVSGRREDEGAFKTPTLREVARRAPYMHDGRLATLEEVIAFYDEGGTRNPSLDSEIRPLRLKEQEKADLLAFLHALTGTVRQ